MWDTPYQINRALGLSSKMTSLAEASNLRPDWTNPLLPRPQVPGAQT